MLTVTVQSLSRDDIKLNSRHLEKFFDQTKVFPNYDTTTSNSLDGAITSALQQWAKTKESSIISFAGDDARWPTISQATLLAAAYVESAKKVGIPVVSYFCELTRGEKLREENFREAQELLALTCSLIHQLIHLLPLAIPGEHDFSASRFEQVDGTLGSWEWTLEILKDLLSSIPNTVYCIINGFQWLDDKILDGPLKHLLQILRGDGMHAGQNLKVLITTQGRSRYLEKELAITELLCADQVGPPYRGSRRTRGRPFVTNIITAFES